MIEWSFEPVFGNYFTVAALGLASLLAILLIRLDGKLSRGKRWTLNFLRFVTMLAIFFAMLHPGLTLTNRSAPNQTIAVLVDTSASMQLPSGDATNSRWNIEQRVLSAIESHQLLLGAEIEWQLFAYDGLLRSVLKTGPRTTNDPKATWESYLPATPQGVLTDVGKPFSEILSAVTDPPLLAVIWMGDGAQTTRGDTSDAQQSARQFSHLDIPIYLIGIGPRSGAEQTRDQILEGIPDQSEAFAKNLVPIRGSLRAIGLQNRELTVRVFLVEENKKATMLNQTTVKPTQLDQSLPFQLSITAPDPGAYQLLVKAEGVDGEATLLNNEQTCFLNVRNTGSRILYLEGQPRQEQKFIRMALAESRDLQVDAQRYFEATRDRWPVDLTELLQGDLFDCIILGDLDSEALGLKSLTRIVELVQNGVGLMTLGGYHAYGSGGYQKTPLATILPIEMDGVRQAFGQPINEKGHWIGDIPLEPRGPHPITDLGAAFNGAENQPAQKAGNTSHKQENDWKQLKPLLGANRWRSIREGPGVQILAIGPENQPLIVSSEAGRGRILCMAFDSSYRWWREGKSEYHRQFWRQSVLWTMRREVAEEGLRLDMPKRTLALGESSPYTVVWSPGSKRSTLPTDLEIRWSIDREDRGPLVPQKASPNLLNGQIVQVSKPGRYEITARATNSEGKQIESKLPFIVVDMAIEKIQAAPDWQLINQLAKLNESAGGKVIAPEAVDDIFKALAERKRTATVESVQTFRLGDGPIDSWIAFLVIVLLWSLQWSLRKSWNLP